MNQPTFEELGVSPELATALADSGIHRPFAIQALTIADALAGRDVCGKAKTGSGKTLAFGLPLLQLASKAEPMAPTALVLVPTRELCLQVHDVLAPLGQVADAEGHSGDIRWNFEKFLIAPDGSITRFSPMVTPDDPTLVEAIEASLPR